MEVTLNSIKKDAQLADFLRKDCNISEIASKIIASDSAASHGNDENNKISSHSERFIQKLNDAVHNIEKAISDHVGIHHATLLEQVGSVDGLQCQVSTLHASVNNLKHSIHQLEKEVKQYYCKLNMETKKHRNVEKCGELVRKTIRFNQLSDKINRSSFANNPDQKVARHNTELGTIAIAIREIEGLVNDLNFEKMSIVTKKLPNIRKISRNIRLEMRALLKDGIETLSQADVGVALQVLLHLDNLKESVEIMVNNVIQDVERKCVASISEDVLINRSSSTAPEGITQKADVWRAIQRLFDILRVHSLQIWNLQRVLVKMVEPVSGKHYLDMVIQRDEPTLFCTFWEVTCAIIREILVGALDYRASVKSVLIASYPRMREEAVRVLDDLYSSTTKQLESDPIFSLPRQVKSQSSNYEVVKEIAGSTGERAQFFDSMSPIADAFNERCFQRIATPIQMMFPQSTQFHASPPSRSDMQTLGRTILAELDEVGTDPVLIDGVLNEIHKSVNLFCTNVKKMVNGGKHALHTTPSYGRTPSQAHNVSLVSVLHQLSETLESISKRTNAVIASSSTSFLSKADFSLDQKLYPCQKSIGELQTSILGPYLQALVVILESIIAKMHEESFGDYGNDSNQLNCSTGSRYMVEFAGAFTTIYEEHIKKLPDCTLVQKCIDDLMARIISVFVRHAAMLRPLHEKGKMRLASDMAQLELKLESVMQLRTLGSTYDELRSFRHMMFLDTFRILRDSVIDKIRPTNVWHHLIGRCPPELQLPHQFKKISAAKYIEWLETAAGIHGTFSPSSSSSKASQIVSLPLGYACLKDPKVSLLAEKEGWKEVSKCLDSYSQRMSASLESEVSPIFEILLEAGPSLLAGYEITVRSG